MSRTRTGGAWVALLLANARYWSTVAPLVRARLAHWGRRAEAIPDPLLRALATGKLREERFNVELAATLATLAPRAHRGQAVRAIVALQVMYDYLDLLAEQPAADAPADCRCLFEALVDALTPGGRSDGVYYRHNHPRSRDGGYLRELVRTVRLALATLPAAEAIGEPALRAAKRCAQAQALSHTAARNETVELERWAGREAAGGGWAPQDGGRAGLQWPEYLAGAAASVLAVHALIAAAADPRTTRGDAERIDAVYLSIGALTMLDSLVDREHDVATGELSYVELYESPEAMAASLAALASETASRARALPRGAHHVMTLVGVVAYYASAPAASSALAQPVMARVREELRPLIAPTLAVMRAWRLAKRLRGARPVVSSI